MVREQGTEGDDLNRHGEAAVDRIVSDLEAAGTAEDGQFTLDRDKALEKMEQFQLEDPWAFVLELVQAAVLKGATAVDFEIGPRRLELRFDGRPFEDVELDNIYSALLGRQDTEDRRAAAGLALAINACKRLLPHRIEVGSGDGVKGARLLVTAEGETFESLDEPLQGTKVTIDYSKESRKSRSLNPRGVGRLWDEVYIKERCAFSHVEVTIDKKQISEGLALNDGFGVTSFEGGGFKGVAGYLPDLCVSVMHLIMDGVLVSTSRLPMNTPGYVAVVASSGFKRDLSHSAVVQDELFTEAKEKAMAVQGKVLEALEKTSPEKGIEKGFPGMKAWIHETVAKAKSGVKKEERKKGGGFPVPLLTPRRIREPRLLWHFYKGLQGVRFGVFPMGQLLGALLLSLGMGFLLLWLMAPLHGPGTLYRFLKYGFDRDSMHQIISLTALVVIVVLGVVLSMAVRRAVLRIKMERRILERGEIVSGVIKSFESLYARVELEGKNETHPWDYQSYQVETHQTIPVAVLREHGETHITLPRCQNVVFWPSRAEERHLAVFAADPAAGGVFGEWGFPLPADQRRKRRMAVWGVILGLLAIIVAILSIRLFLAWWNLGRDMRLAWAHVVKTSKGEPKLLLMHEDFFMGRVWRMELIDPRTGRRDRVRMGSGWKEGPNCGAAHPGRFWCHTEIKRDRHLIELWRVEDLVVDVSHERLIRMNPELGRDNFHIYQRVDLRTGEMVIDAANQKRLRLSPKTLKVARVKDERDVIELHMGQRSPHVAVDVGGGKLELEGAGNEKHLVIRRSGPQNDVKVSLVDDAVFENGRFLVNYLDPSKSILLEKSRAVLIGHKQKNHKEYYHRNNLITAVAVPGGDILWEARLKPGELMLVQLFSDLLVVVGRMHPKGSWAAGIDTSTGKVRWKR